MPKLRISLCKNSGNEKGREIGLILVNPEYNDVLKAIKNKLRLKIKDDKIRLFIAKRTQVATAGLELTHDNISKFLCNDTIICVSEGENFCLAKDMKNNECELVCPFNWGSEDYILLENVHEEDIVNTNINNHKFIIEKQSLQLYKMNGIFPILEDDILHSLKEITRNNSVFVERDFGEYSAFDYKSATHIDFPNPTQFKNNKDKWMAGLKREMRGLIVCNKTGRVLARRFHKFFNVNECDESQLDNIQFDSNSILTKKIDGSLVSPFLLNNSIVWALRGVIIDKINSNIYCDFVQHCILNNFTPLFEFCESDHIVGIIEHAQNMLILLAVRHMITGNYMKYDEVNILAQKYNVPVVEKITPNQTNLHDITNAIRNMSQQEGFVLQNNQQIYKIKTMWYVAISQALKNGNNRNTTFLLELIKKRPIVSDIPIYKIYNACLDSSVDDNISMCCSLLPQPESLKLKNIANMFLTAINKYHNSILKWIDNSLTKESPDTIIQSMINSNFDRLLAISYVNNRHSSKDTLIRKLKKMCNYHCIEQLNEILNICNSKAMETIDINGVHYELEPILNFTFGECEPVIKNHILEKNLPRKITNLMGISMGELADTSIIHINSSYVGSEENVIGMCENFEITDLRIDLQPQRNQQYDEHYGNSEFALFLVQCGIAKKTDCGKFAGILVPTNTNVAYSVIKFALMKSFDMKKIIKISCVSDVSNIIKQNIYCDLDGVLVDFDKGVYDISDKHPSDFEKVGMMWREINRVPTFWENLQWMQDGKVLWEFLVNCDCNLQIITGLPTGGWNVAKKGKHIWCDTNLCPTTNVIMCLGKEKYKFCKQGDILIDDRLEYKEAWENAGGIFVHHTDSLSSIQKLISVISQLMTTTNELNDEKTIEIVEMNDIVYIDNSENDNVATFVAKINCAQVVAFDIEWRPDEITQKFEQNSKSLPSIIQIALKSEPLCSQVFMLDCLDMNISAFQEFIKVLENKDVQKLYFSIGNDVDRLFALVHHYKLYCTGIRNIIDLQTDNKSLKTFVKETLNVNLNKNKTLQSSDWELRPLSVQQLKYSALDSYVLILQKIISESVSPIDITYTQISGNYIFSTERYQEHCEIANVTPLCKSHISHTMNYYYVAVFLTIQTKRIITELFPPKYINKYIDHITLKYKPTYEEVCGFKLGDIVNFVIVGFCSDDKCQTVVVRLMDHDDLNHIIEDLQHITISTKTNTSPAYSNELIAKGFEKYDMKRTVLKGKIGVLVTIEKSSELLGELQDDIKNMLYEFLNDSQKYPNSSKLKFEKGQLSSIERKIIHDFAEFYKLESESDGQKEARQLTLTKPKHWNLSKKHLENLNDNNDKIIKITDKKSKFRDNLSHKPTMRLIFDNAFVKDNGTIKNNPVGNFALDGKIIWKFFNCDTIVLDTILLGKDVNNIVIIMRGPPGCGKSTLSNMIKNVQPLNCVGICSADQYFDMIGEFNETKLNEAHEYCRNMFHNNLENLTNIIVVDNTNIKLKHYSYYKRKAIEHCRKVIIIEFDKNQNTTHRNVHNVPQQVLNKMISSYKHDDNALVLTSCESFEL